MRFLAVLPLLILHACHAPAQQASLPADPANETAVEQSTQNSQFAVEDEIFNDADNEEAADANAS